jgi:hypothetical protein
VTRFALSRRSFLRGSLAGAAVSLALPPLEAMLDGNGAYADGSMDEPVFGLFFWANGVPWNAKHGEISAGFPDVWTPDKIGPDYTPSEMLKPLERHKVIVVTGLEPKTAVPPTPPGQEDGHMRGFMVAMTGDRPRSQGFDHPTHTLTALRPTLDQVVARDKNFYKTPPRFRSLQVGVSPARFHEYGHWNAISYNGPDSVNPPIMNPGELFDKLFGVPGDSADLERRARVFDAVLDDSKQLKGRLSANDRARLDAHLEHLFEIQRRLRSTSAACMTPDRPTPETDLHKKTTEMADLLAVALTCGLTRVFSFMLTSPASTHHFSNLGVADDHHTTCHNGVWEAVRSVTRYQMEAFSRVLDSLLSTRLPTGRSVFDNACILGTSEYGEGWKHSTKELPVILAGRACGRLKLNVHAREPDGNLARAQLTVLQALGLPYTSFGFSGAETSMPLSEVMT